MKKIIEAIHQYNLFRNTAIVDDDFPERRHKTDSMFNHLRQEFGNDFPTVVCLLGSTKYKKEILQEMEELTLNGCIVLVHGAFPHTDYLKSGEEVYGVEAKARLQELHCRKIDLADEVLVIDVDGYIGQSTKEEIEYALTKGKPVKYYSNFYSHEGKKQ